MDSFAAHLIQLSEGKDIDDAKFQIIAEYNKSNKIWIRKAFNSNGQNMSVYTKWEQIYPDYSNLSLALNGYIIFTNGLIIQWLNILIDAAVGAEISQDNMWTKYLYYYNFNFPNNTYSNNIQLSGVSWTGIDTSKILFNTKHTKNEYTILMPTNFINTGSGQKQLWCNVLVIGS